MFNIQAEPRSTGVKAKHLRQQGLIPGCVYGADIDKSIPLQIAESEIKKLLKTKAEGGKVSLRLDGKKTDVLLREISRHPVNRKIEHISFQRIKGDETVNNAAQIVLVNKDKIPLFVNQIIFSIPYRSPASKIIEKIEIDLEGMHEGGSIKVNDLDIAGDEDIELMIDPESLVISIS